jgi:ribosome-binding protein aMBF1 (putative translation factor)
LSVIATAGAVLYLGPLQRKRGKVTSDATAIGNRIRRLRTERGLSQRQIAMPGVSYAYISRIEGGQRRPSEKALWMIAARLGVTALYLECGGQVKRCPHCGSKL